jgi:hypothetical protein
VNAGLLVTDGETLIGGMVLTTGNTDSRCRFPADAKTFVNICGKMASHITALWANLNSAHKIEKLAAILNIKRVRVC